MKALAALSTSLLLLASCKSMPLVVTSTIEADRGSKVRVLGERPRVEIENKGPGVLLVAIDSRSGMAAAQELYPNMMTMCTFLGPVIIRLEVSRGDACEYWVTAHGAVEISSMPADTSTDEAPE